MVELRQVCNRVKLVYHAVFVGLHDHAQLFDVVDVDVLPQLRRGLRLVVFRLQNGAELLGKCAVEIHVAQHDPRAATAHAHAHDATIARRLQAVFVRFAREIRRCIVGLVHVRAEHVLRKIVVRRADTGIAQLLAHQHERGIVITAGILLVYADLHAKRVL